MNKKSFVFPSPSNIASRKTFRLAALCSSLHVSPLWNNSFVVGAINVFPVETATFILLAVSSILHFQSGFLDVLGNRRRKVL